MHFKPFVYFGVSVEETYAVGKDKKQVTWNELIMGVGFRLSLFAVLTSSHTGERRLCYRKDDSNKAGSAYVLARCGRLPLRLAVEEPDCNNQIVSSGVDLTISYA